MSKLFFDHLVIREEIEVELDGYTINPEDKQEILDIVDQTITSQVLNVILNHLPKDKHGDFISKFSIAPHDPLLLDYLKLHAHSEIEDKIKTHSAKVKKEILSEIKRTSQKH